jgi:hypothetical protein
MCPVRTPVTPTHPPQENIEVQDVLRTAKTLKIIKIKCLKNKLKAESITLMVNRTIEKSRLSAAISALFAVSEPQKRRRSSTLRPNIEFQGGQVLSLVP